MNHIIDFHAHIIPHADHGCDSAEEAAMQLMMMHNAGVATVVATPHFYPNQHNVADYLSAVDRGIEALCQARPEHSPKLYAGAEILLCPNIHRMPDFEKLCIRGTNVLLLELPFCSVSDDIFETVDDILSLGYTVVLAHINRYLHMFRDQIDELLDMGALAQINATALTGFWERRRLMPYLRSEKVVAFGSDLHGQDQYLLDAFSSLEKLPQDTVARIFERSAALLANAEEVK